MRKIALSLLAAFAGCVLWASDNLDYGAAGVRALPSPPQLRPGVRFVPDSDFGAESMRKGAKWPKSGVFSGDKEVDSNF